MTSLFDQTDTSTRLLLKSCYIYISLNCF